MVEQSSEYMLIPTLCLPLLRQFSRLLQECASLDASLLEGPMILKRILCREYAEAGLHHALVEFHVASSCVLTVQNNTIYVFQWRGKIQAGTPMATAADVPAIVPSHLNPSTCHTTSLAKCARRQGLGSHGTGSKTQPRSTKPTAADAKA